MGQINDYFRSGHGTLVYWCQGCDETHHVVVEGQSPWGFNGDYERPTFSPSVLVRSGHHIKGGQPGDCWCDFEQRFGTKPSFSCTICHTFITDGMVNFLGDCTHELAGQMLPLPKLPDHLRD